MNAPPACRRRGRHATHGRESHSPFGIARMYAHRSLVRHDRRVAAENSSAMPLLPAAPAAGKSAGRCGATRAAAAGTWVVIACRMPPGCEKLGGGMRVGGNGGGGVGSDWSGVMPRRHCAHGRTWKVPVRRQSPSWIRRKRRPEYFSETARAALEAQAV